MDVNVIGSLCFGLVVGWVTYRTLRRKEGGNAALSDIATVIGAVGGGAVTALFQDDTFGYYSIGLAVGFFLYFFAGLWIGGKEEVNYWMGD